MFMVFVSACGEEQQKVDTGTAVPAVESPPVKTSPTVTCAQVWANPPCAFYKIIIIHTSACSLCTQLIVLCYFLFLCVHQWYRDLQSTISQTHIPASPGNRPATGGAWSLWEHQSQSPFISPQPPPEPAWWQIRPGGRVRQKSHDMKAVLYIWMTRWYCAFG